MNWVDLLILAALGLSLANGYRRGAVMQVFSWGGFFAGLFIGALVASPILDAIDPKGPTARLVLGLVGFMGTALVVEALIAFGGARVARRITHHTARRADGIAGSVVSGALVLIAVWIVSPVAGRQPELAPAVKDSAIVRAEHAVLSDPPDLFAAIGALLNRTGFPQVFSQFNPSLAPGVEAAPESLKDDDEVLAAARVTYKIESSGCGGVVDGTGFPVGPGTLITAAHVVAGTHDTRAIEANGDGPFPASVVYIDPDTDIAVLRSATAPPHALDVDPGPAGRGTDGAAIGYPGGGPRTITPARVRDRIDALGYDIYSEKKVSREIYVLRGTVRKGNSGGPFVDTDGRVRGMIFAAAADRDEESYALAESEIERALRGAGDRQRGVDTGECATL